MNVMQTPSPDEIADPVRAAEAVRQRAAMALWGDAPKRMQALAEAQARFAEAWFALAFAPFTAFRMIRGEKIVDQAGTGADPAH